MPAEPGTGDLPGWFIYYRVDETELAAVCAAVRLFQGRLRADWPGLQTELLRRPDTAAGPLTLMEIYRSPDLQYPPHPALAAAIETAAGALGPVLAGQRHRESFVPCA